MEGLTAAQESGFATLAKSLDEHGQRAEMLLQDLAGKLDAVAENVEQVWQAALDVQAEQQRQGGQLAEMYRLLQQLLEQTRLQQRGEVRPGDSRSIRGDAERRRVRDLVDRYSALPEQERQSRPALLNAVGLLQVAAGDAEGAQRSFDTVATLVADPAAQAQVRFNAYQAALERKDFTSALRELREAIRLDPQRYAPFPTDRFAVERILGAGGFGVAFLCQHLMLRRPVVVKTLRLEDLDRDADEVFREAQTLNDLDHAAIIKLRDCGFADARRQRPYLVMDFFDGMSLGEYVVRYGLLTGEQLLPLARAVAEGLKAAHDQGVLHRDVKPDNILVRRESAGWKVKLIDFGLALRQEKAEDTLRSAGPQATPQGMDFAGTLDYAAPEQMGKLLGAAVGPHSDVYGFGRTCYFALLGVPDPGDDEKQTLPEDWRRLLSQCTARKLENRLRDFGQVLARLAEIRSGPVSSKPASSAAIPAPPLAPALTLPPPQSRPAPVNPGVPPRYVPPTPAAQPAQPKLNLADMWGQPASAGQSSNAPAEPPRTTGKNVLGSAFGNPGSEGPASEPPPPPPSPPDPPKKKRGDGPLGGAFS
jgi:serine/threonine protein kinase